MQTQPNIKIATKEVELRNGHKGLVFIITEGWAWDLEDLRWVRLVDQPVTQIV